MARKYELFMYGYKSSILGGKDVFKDSKGDYYIAWLNRDEVLIQGWLYRINNGIWEVYDANGWHAMRDNWKEIYYECFINN